MAHCLWAPYVVTLNVGTLYSGRGEAIALGGRIHRGSRWNALPSTTASWWTGGALTLVPSASSLALWVSWTKTWLWDRKPKAAKPCFRNRHSETLIKAGLKEQGSGSYQNEALHLPCASSILKAGCVSNWDAKLTGAKWCPHLRKWIAWRYIYLFHLDIYSALFLERPIISLYICSRFIYYSKLLKMVYTASKNLSEVA